MLKCYFYILSVQETAYWSMNMHSYKFGPSGPGSNSYYGNYYEVNDHLPRMDVSRRTWEHPSVMNSEEPANIDSHPEEEDAVAEAAPEEC